MPFDKLSQSLGMRAIDEQEEDTPQKNSILEALLKQSPGEPSEKDHITQETDESKPMGMAESLKARSEVPKQEPELQKSFYEKLKDSYNTVNSPGMQDFIKKQGQDITDQTMGFGGAMIGSLAPGPKGSASAANNLNRGVRSAEEVAKEVAEKANSEGLAFKRAKAYADMAEKQKKLNFIKKSLGEDTFNNLSSKQKEDYVKFMEESLPPGFPD